MKIQYDKEVDAKYITLFSGEKVEKTAKQEDWLLVDSDKTGRIVGIEILDASKHQISFAVSDNRVQFFSTKTQTLKDCDMETREGVPLSESVGVVSLWLEKEANF